MRSSRATSRSACSRTASGMPASSIFLRYSSATLASSSPSSLRIDSICLRRKYSRCCFSAPERTSSRMRSRTWSSVQAARAGAARAFSSRSVTSRVSSSSTFCSKLEVRRVAARVGQRARLGDRAHEGGDAAVVAAQLEDLLDHGAVLALELAGSPVERLVVGVRLDLDAEVAARVGAGRRRPRRGGGRSGPRPSRRRAGARAPRPRPRCPTLAKSPSWRGTSSTRSSSPTSTVRVTVMLGKTTESSTGTSSRVSMSFPSP